MKITIEQGRGPKLQGQWGVVFETDSNEELTSEIVDLALRAVVAYGHNQGNVIEAARDWADEMETVTKMD